MSGGDPERGETAAASDGGPHPDVTFDESGADGSPSVGDADRVERLRAANARLRRQYGQARRTEYERTSVGLAAVGALAVGAAVLFPSVREVLVVVGSIGLFSALLTRYLAPEQFVPVNVAEGIYDSVDETRGSLVAELDLAGEPRYVPADGGAVRLFVPQRDGVPLPDPAELGSTLVVPGEGDRRGVAFSPSGETLFAEFRRTLGGPLAESPRGLATQLAEGVSEGLELVDRVTTDVDPGGGRLSFRVEGVPFGDLGRMDHPVVSVLGVGLAAGLDAPVVVADARTDDETDAGTISYTWAATAGAGAPSDERPASSEGEEGETRNGDPGASATGASRDSPDPENAGVQ